MRKWITPVLTALATVAGPLVMKAYFDAKTRRKAREARPKVEALLDEMIRIASEWKQPMDRLVMSNETSVVNDEKRDRDLMLGVGGDWYHLDVGIRLTGKKAGHVCVRLSRRRGEARLHLYWPDVADYAPPEPWLVERLERLDALVGDASRRKKIDGILKRYDPDPDGGGFKTN